MAPHAESEEADHDAGIDHHGGAEEEPCPVLDPETGACDLYDARPLTCRVFGPAVRSEGGVGACELCYVGAGDEEIAGCAVELDAGVLDDDRETTVAAAVKQASRPARGAKRPDRP